MSATRRLIKPLLDRVLVEKITPPTKSLGGVLLPESMTAGKVRERFGGRRPKREERCLDVVLGCVARD